MSGPLWRLQKARAAQTLLAAFSGWMAARAGKSFVDYEALRRYSTDELGRSGRRSGISPAYWAARAIRRILADADTKEGAGAALVFWGENKVHRRVTWDELRAEVARTAILSNMPEVIMSVLAMTRCRRAEAIAISDYA